MSILVWGGASLVSAFISGLRLLSGWVHPGSPFRVLVDTFGLKRLQQEGRELDGKGYMLLLMCLTYHLRPQGYSEALERVVCGPLP